MRKMPRLIADVRWRKIRSRPIHIALFCAAAYGAWCALEYFSGMYRAEGNALLAEMARELDCLSGGAVDKVTAVRMTIGMAASAVNAALKEERYSYDGDPRQFASTREDERQHEAKGYVAEYRTSVERRDRLADRLKSEIGKDGVRAKIEKRLDGIVASDASRSPEAAERLKRAMMDFRKILDLAVVPPWFYQRAREEARLALERARRTASGVEWMRELASVEAEANDFSRSIKDGIAEMRKCDGMARTSMENLAKIPFGGKHLKANCLEKLSVAERTAAEAETRALAAFGGAVESFWASVSDASNRIEKAVSGAEGLLALHGPEFVDEKELEGIRGQKAEFANAVASAKDALDKANRDFRDAVGRRKGLFAKVGELREEFSSVSSENEADVEDICLRASRLTTEVGASRLDDALLATTNSISDTVARLVYMACLEETQLAQMESKLPDWNEYCAQNSTAKLSQARARVGKCSKDLSETAKKLPGMSGDACGDFLVRACELSDAARSLLASIPESIDCENGKEATAADGKANEYAGRARELELAAAAFLKEYGEAVESGTISEVVYESIRQEWAYYMGLGRNTFVFALELPGGRHNIEISASKATGQLFPKNKMARGIELAGELADSSGNKAIGSLVFGNTVAEVERKLLSFKVDGSAGRRDFVLKLTLVHKHNALGGTTMSDWDTGKLKIRLKVDGAERDSVLVRKLK